MHWPGTLTTHDGELYGIAGPVAGQILWPSTEHSGSIASSLPHDVLSYIFKHVYGDDNGKLDNQETGKRDIIAVTEACRRWREVATGSPRLWTRISLYNVNLATLYLERSKRMPVDIRVNADERVPNYDNVAAVLSPHLSRIRSLSVARLTRNTLDGWMCYFNAHVSLDGLQDLELSVWPEGAWRYAAVDAIVLADDAAEEHRCHTPSLRRLRLLGILYPPSSTLYDNLVSLTITGARSSSITLEDLLHILGKPSPSLTSLELSDLSIKHIEYTPANQLPQFPRLKHLALNELVPEECSALLNHLTLPAGFTRFSCRSRPDGHGGTVVPFPPQRLDLSTEIRRLAFQGKYREARDCDRSLWQTRIAAYETANVWRSSIPVAEVYLPDGPQLPCLRGALEWLAPNVRETRRLMMVNMLSSISVSSWRTEILSELPNLSTIQLLGCEESTITLLQALSGPAYTGTEYLGPDSMGPSAPPMVCPKVNWLELSEYPRSRTAHRKWNTGDLAAHARFWDALETMLVWRRSVGAPIKTLCLYDVPRPTDDGVLDRIRKAVEVTFSVYVHREEAMDVDIDPPHTRDGRLWHNYQRAWRLGYLGAVGTNAERLPITKLDVGRPCD